MFYSCTPVATVGVKGPTIMSTSYKISQITWLRGITQYCTAAFCTISRPKHSTATAEFSSQSQRGSAAWYYFNSPSFLTGGTTNSSSKQARRLRRILRAEQTAPQQRVFVDDFLHSLLVHTKPDIKQANHRATHCQLHQTTETVHCSHTSELGLTVFHGPRNFEPSSGICPLPRNLNISAEFEKWPVISTIVGVMSDSSVTHFSRLTSWVRSFTALLKKKQKWFSFSVANITQYRWFCCSEQRNFKSWPAEFGQHFLRKTVGPSYNKLVHLQITKPSWLCQHGRDHSSSENPKSPQQNITDIVYHTLVKWGKHIEQWMLNFLYPTCVYGPH